MALWGAELLQNQICLLSGCRSAQEAQVLPRLQDRIKFVVQDNDMRELFLMARMLSSYLCHTLLTGLR